MVVLANWVGLTSPALTEEKEALMRRTILLGTVSLVVAAMMALAGPAVALEPSAGPGQSSCVGHAASELSGPGFGQFVSSQAGPGFGKFVSGQAHVQPCPPHED